MAEKKSLVIVESPSKAKTIGKYLGSEYQVKACMGHLRDLPKSDLGVSIENHFEPHYVPVAGKQALIKELSADAKNADKVYLATDPDREGEAISWHLKQLLKLSDEKALRVTFNEITKKVVSESIQNPRSIDLSLVDAQQARRVLDRIIGYQLSPVLWRKIKGGPRGLAAGRVQSVAVKLVVDRENEIRAFVPAEYWNLSVVLRRESGESLTLNYYGSPKKQALDHEADVQKVLQDIDGKPFTLTGVKRTEKKRLAPPPFTTSTLQQEASRRLNMSPKRTMALAQQLYEGLDVKGVGTVGLITYMRTDSVRISEEALRSAGDFIRSEYGEASYYGSFHTYKGNSNSQDAHEAIRPSDVKLTPQQLAASLNKDQLRLYKLIWSRFLATQMAPAVFDALNLEASCGKHIFKNSMQSLRFPGYLAVYESSDDSDSDETVSLPELRENETLALQSKSYDQHFTQPPARYSEATLVKAMEEKGVGRPSTYATTISVIQDHDYVEKKDKHLIPTSVGETVNGFLERYFNDIVDVDFTAQMEEHLDEVANGKYDWRSLLDSFYTGFEQELQTGTAGEPARVPVEETGELCPLCGKPMVIRMGRFGKFMACTGFPDCKFTRAVVERMPGKCPVCGTGLIKKKSAKGFAYYSCDTGNSCFMTWDIPTDNDCPECGKTLFKRSGKGRSTPFCVNSECSAFLPPEKRGYYKKKDAKTPGGGTLKPEDLDVTDA